MTELKRQIEQAIGAALLKPGGVDLPDIADTVLAVLREQQPVAWGAFHFGGKHHGKLFSHCEMREHIESYILDRHQSDDVNTFRSGPLYAAPMPPSVPDGWELVPTELGTELYDACARACRKGYGWDDLGELMDRIDDAYALKPLAAAPKPEGAT